LAVRDRVAVPDKVPEIPAPAIAPVPVTTNARVTVMTAQVLLPPGWVAPIGYSNGIAAPAGRIVFIAGQVGWDDQQKFRSEDIAPQFEQALKNVLTVLAQAGGEPHHICRMTAYCIDRPAYLAARPELGRIWRTQMGKHYPAMSMIFVSDLLDHPAKIELEATAVVP
jgi:enamine deaminase RidA (YjgF/YER057c/UK114 family)